MPRTPTPPDSESTPQRKREGEAATALTDGLLAVQSAVYAYRLGHDVGRGDHAVQSWRAALASAGLAAAAGAGYHALPPHRWPNLRAALWKVVGVATGAAGTLLLVGGLLESSASTWRRVWVAAAILKSVRLGVTTWQRDDFRYIIYDYGSSLAALGLLQWWKPGPASSTIRRGILLSCLAAAIQQKGPVLHRRFDRNALYHLVQMVALHCFAQAGQRLRDR